MKKKLNEASITLDVNGLESSDFETLSRMLALAGEAESQGANPGFSDLPKMEPFDFDSVGSEETQSIMEPDSALEPSVPGDDGMDALGAAVDDLSGTVTDFGAEEETDDLGLDMDGAPALELDSDEEFSSGDDEFDMDRMSSLAGIQESLTSDIDKSADAEMEEDTEDADENEEDASTELDESLLPDLSLDEDAEAYDNDHRDFGDRHHKVGSPEHGPFRTHDEAVHDGMMKTNGDEYEHFAVIRGKDGFYWRENLQEESSAEWDDHHIPDDRRDFGDDHHVVDSKEHGPFRTEREAVHDAMKVTNGTEFEHFAVIPGQDGYYWRRNLQEELDNEPDPSMVDMDGIENSRHPFQRTPGTALGDNPLHENDYSVEGNPSTEEEQEEMFEDADYSVEGNPSTEEEMLDEEDESVEDILESITARYNSFIKGL